MNIQQYYQIIKQKLESNDYTQIGQYIFNGNIKKAIHTVKNIETGKIILSYKDLEK